MRILVVEDEPLLNAQLRAALEAAGYVVDSAADGREASFMGEVEAYDAVVLDLGLPDGNGVDFIRDLRAWSDVPILVLSARSNEKDKIQALDVGADDYLTKPFGVGELPFIDLEERTIEHPGIKNGEQAHAEVLPAAVG